MASAGTKVILIAMAITMIGHEAVVTAHDCIKDCADSCDSVWCQFGCELKCFRSSAASFFGPFESKRAAFHARGSSLSPSPSPSPSPLPLPLPSPSPSPSSSPLGQPDGLSRKGLE